MQFLKFFDFLFLIGIFEEGWNIIDFCYCFKKVIFGFKAFALCAIFILLSKFLFYLKVLPIYSQSYYFTVQGANFKCLRQRSYFKLRYF